MFARLLPPEPQSVVPGWNEICTSWCQSIHHSLCLPTLSHDDRWYYHAAGKSPGTYVPRYPLRYLPKVLVVPGRTSFVPVPTIPPLLLDLSRKNKNWSLVVSTTFSNTRVLPAQAIRARFFVVYLFIFNHYPPCKSRSGISK